MIRRNPPWSPRQSSIACRRSCVSICSGGRPRRWTLPLHQLRPELRLPLLVAGLRLSHAPPPLVLLTPLVRALKHPVEVVREVVQEAH